MSTSSEAQGEQHSIAGLTESERHDLLASARRRTLLAVLADADGTVGVEELARTVADREPADAGTRGDGATDVQVALHHVHLPKLDQADLVEYDWDAMQVRPDGASLDRLTF